MFDVYIDDFLYGLYLIDEELSQHTTPDPFDAPWEDSLGLHLDWGALPPELDPAYRPAFWAPTPRGACAPAFVPCDVPF